ncbi:MAG: ComEC/Rec2 family competence protein [Candidatus Omnitrophica bacterium]|nr:ComEC/Rec2 family competence protein [Candidatus Omnitrophota bacterium]
MSSSSPLSVSVHEGERRWLAIPPIFFISIAFALGIWAADLASFSFFVVVVFACFILAVSVFLAHKPSFILLIILVFFATGILFGTNGQTISEQDISLVAPQGRLVLEGTVMTLPETRLKGKKETVSFVLESHSFFRKGIVQDVSGKVQVFLHNPGRVIRYGDRLRLKGMLEVPQTSRNFHTFDYRAYLAQNGISRIFRGVGRFSVVRQWEGSANQFLLAANRFRDFLRGRLALLFPFPHRELANALILGFKRGIPDEIQDAFIKTGTAHLLAISGLNISLVGGLFYFLTRLLSKSRSVNLLLTISFIAIYTVLAGANLPVLRAGIMGIVILLGFLLGQERNLKSAFFFAFFALLVWNPRSLFLASFQLSFVAMASLIFILPRLQKTLGFGSAGEEIDSFLIARRQAPATRLRRFWAALRHSIVQTFLSSLTVTIGMFPLLLWYFNLFSLIGFLANLVAIPMCTMAIAAALVLLLIDLVFSPLASGLAFVPLLFFRAELWLIDWFSKVPIGYFYLPRPKLFFFFFYYGFLVAWLILSKRAVPTWVRTGLIAGIGILAVSFLATSSPPSSRLVLFDVGKAEASFVSFSNGGNCLINTGSHFPSDQAYWILRPFFMGSGIQKIDSILMTALDGKRAGGFRTFIHHVPFRALWIPEGSRKSLNWSKYVETGRLRRSKISPLSKGEQIQFGSSGHIYIDILASSHGRIHAIGISDGPRKILFVTSSDATAFDALARAGPFNYEIVFLPHHEFEMSPSERLFLKKISPEYVVLNQHHGISEFREYLRFLTHSTVLFLEETGAVEFSHSRGRWSYRTFLNEDSKFDSSLLWNGRLAS